MKSTIMDRKLHMDRIHSYMYMYIHMMYCTVHCSFTFTCIFIPFTALVRLVLHLASERKTIVHSLSGGVEVIVKTLQVANFSYVYMYVHVQYTCTCSSTLRERSDVER